MRIVNDKIYIIKGETPTYNALVINKYTGAPYIIDSGVENPYIEFIVRPSIYNRKDDYVFRLFLDCSSVHRFSSVDVVEYSQSVWDNDVPPSAGDENKLFRRTVDGVSDYRYFDPDATGSGTDYKWIPYEFVISFMFPYSATSLMEAKQYKYEISLYGGSVKSNPKPDEIPINITYKDPILEATDFIVGGSISE